MKPRGSMMEERLRMAVLKGKVHYKREKVCVCVGEIGRKGDCLSLLFSPCFSVTL